MELAQSFVIHGARIHYIHMRRTMFSSFRVGVLRGARRHMHDMVDEHMHDLTMATRPGRHLIVEPGLRVGSLLTRAHSANLSGSGPSPHRT